MDRHGYPYATTHRSIIGQIVEPTNNPENDDPECYRNLTRHPQRGQDQVHMDKTISGTRQGMKSRRLAADTPQRTIHATKVEQRSKQTSGETFFAEGTPDIGPHTTLHAGGVDPRLHETGSQFSDSRHSTVQEQNSYSTRSNHANFAEVTDPYASRSRSGRDDAYAQSRPLSPYGGYNLQRNQPSYTLDGVTYSSPSKLAGPDPWYHPAIEDSSAFSPQYNSMSVSNVPTAYDPVSQYSDNVASSFYRSNPSYGPTPLAEALQPSRHNFQGNNGSNDSGPYHAFTSRPTSSLYNGQGRPPTRATPTKYSYEDTSSLPSIGASSRPGISPTTQTSGNISDRLTGPTASPARHASTMTTNTSMSLTSQASGPSASPPRYQNRPDPLPCPTCQKPFNGHDRITNMVRHDREAHQQIRTRCPSPNCHKEFTRPSNLRRHRETREKNRER